MKTWLKAFLKRLRLFFAPSSSRSEEAAVATIQKVEFRPEDTTGRILFEGHWHKKDKQNMRVKYAAYTPMRNTDKARLETSIFKIVGLNTNQISELGEFVAAERKKPWLGHSELNVIEIEVEKLQVESTPEYHPLHGDIIQWPEDKAEQKEIAIRLAKAAKLHLRSSI